MTQPATTIKLFAYVSDDDLQLSYWASDAYVDSGLFALNQRFLLAAPWGSFYLQDALSYGMCLPRNQPSGRMDCRYVMESIGINFRPNRYDSLMSLVPSLQSGVELIMICTGWYLKCGPCVTTLGLHEVGVK